MRPTGCGPLRVGTRCSWSSCWRRWPARPLDDSTAEQGLEESRHRFELAENRSERVLTATSVSVFATLLGEVAEAAGALGLAERLATELHEDEAKIITYFTSVAALFTGRWSSAERLLAETCANNLETGELGMLSTSAALHAHALLHNGQPEQAREQVDLSQRIGGEDDVLNQGLVPAAQAWLAALDGDRPAWELHVAVATVALSDGELPMRALIHETCAEAAVALGEHAVAHQHRQQALDLHRAKGNVVSIARLQEMV
jgi:hypothetical protein